MSLSRITASRGTLQRLRERLAVARRGKEVLEMRREQLVREVLSRAKRIEERVALDNRLFELYGKAIELYLTLGEYEFRSFCSAAKGPRIQVLAESIYGIRALRVRVLEGPDFSAISNPRVREIAESLYKALSDAIALAVEEEAIRAVASHLEYVNRVTNSLEKVVIPQLEEMIRYISERLEEEMIGEFTTLKKVKRLRERGGLSGS